MCIYLKALKVLLECFQTKIKQFLKIFQQSASPCFSYQKLDLNGAANVQHKGEGSVRYQLICHQNASPDMSSAFKNTSSNLVQHVEICEQQGSRQELAWEDEVFLPVSSWVSPPSFPLGQVQNSLLKLCPRTIILRQDWHFETGMICA